MLEPILSKTSVALGLYSNVTNSLELKELIENEAINAALIKADMVVDVFELLAATNKAFFMKSQNKLKTRSVFSEILFWLSPSNKISECFKLFGLHDNTSNVLIVTSPEDSDKVHNLIKGDVSDLSKLSDICDKETLFKIYKVNGNELENTSLSNWIVSQLSAKEIR